jgi:uncharacterized protein YdaU (DUF1376 family)
MSKSEQWVRFFPNDWLTGTAHLKCLEKGVYITLVALMYDNNGPIENDPKWLAGQCGLTRPAFDRALEKLILVKKITTEDGSRLSNEKCQKTITFRTEKISIMKRKAMVTNIKKAMKSTGKVVGGRSHSVTHSESHSGAKPEPESLYSSFRTSSYPPTPRKAAPSLASPSECGSLGATADTGTTKVDKGPAEGKQAPNGGVDNSAAVGQKQVFGLTKVAGSQSDLTPSAASEPDRPQSATANGADFSMTRKSATLEEALARLGRGVRGEPVDPQPPPPESKRKTGILINGIPIDDVPDRPPPATSWQKLGEQF